MALLKRAHIREVLEVTGLTFVLAVVGIETKGLESLALFWPANAALIGWFLRRLRIPTEAGRGFRFEVGRHSDVKPATVPI
ncbi:MAG: hypothetical protein ACRC67_36285 [Inquilinus sp.]|uniref:hypothetical protein n=1 Tax=Inquilinus sp. TaxID=1932117 RepID=UPI003F2D5CA3